MYVVSESLSLLFIQWPSQFIQQKINEVKLQLQSTSIENWRHNITAYQRLGGNPDIVECIEFNVETFAQIQIFATLGVRVFENDDLPEGPFPGIRLLSFKWNPVVFAIAKIGYKATNRGVGFVRDTSLRHLSPPQIDALVGKWITSLLKKPTDEDIERCL